MEPLTEAALDSTVHVSYRRRAVRSYEPTPLAEGVVRDLDHHLLLESAR
ncbi:MAG: hypothetical protein HYR75_08795, partial [Gemmatimonadetes bacterium]|nr:hypothetical protein [Gemmatimonadota bacterium]